VRVQSLLTSVVPSRRIVQVGAASDRLSEGCKAPEMGYLTDVDRPGPWWTGSLMEKLIFIRVNLFDVRVIMMIMHVPVEELLCQVVMGMYFSARVPVVRSVWVLVATFCHARY
jgi:hypothetical protein